VQSEQVVFWASMVVSNAGFPKGHAEPAGHHARPGRAARNVSTPSTRELRPRIHRKPWHNAVADMRPRSSGREVETQFARSVKFCATLDRDLQRHGKLLRLGSPIGGVTHRLAGPRPHWHCLGVQATRFQVRGSPRADASGHAAQSEGDTRLMFV
jgi:hypothetical protein